MAIDSCPECNGKLSDKAVTCPHCGFGTGKVTSKATTRKDVVLIAIVMVGFMGVLGFVAWFFTHLANKV